MPRNKANCTVPKYEPTNIGLIVLFALGSLVVGGFCLLIIFSVPDSTSNRDPITDFIGKFFIVVFAFVSLRILLDLLVALVRYGSDLGGNFNGQCPYCNAKASIYAGFKNASGAIDCNKCKKRIVLKNSRFYQLDLPARLEAKFAPVKEGIGLVKQSILVACFLPVAIIVGLFSGILTFFTPFYMLGFFAPIVLCAVVSLSIKVRGVVLCLQTPNRVSGEQWVKKTVWLEGIAIALLALQLILRADWLDLPIQAVILAGQFTFLSYLMVLSSFVQRSDLAGEFDGLRWRPVLLIGILLLMLTFTKVFQTPIVVVLAIFSFNCLRSYLHGLDLLRKHLEQAISAPS
ncbi:MAG: hypothetical protein NW220_12630 [Leptolyngbyaceae cyanobacterium bins.349]|nr:hypothetical protein [Leptolyngbyaceae cyanobacterium bins.349]